MLPVTISTWKSNPDFLHFLQFEFDLHASPAKVKREVLTLLPLAVGDDRMYGSIAGAVLREALRVWNQPVLWHVFQRQAEGWRYVGGFADKPRTIFPCFHGRLRRMQLKPGNYCRRPADEIIFSPKE